MEAAILPAEEEEGEGKKTEVSNHSLNTTD
jgi:hypothetical protein